MIFWRDICGSHTKLSIILASGYKIITNGSLLGTLVSTINIEKLITHSKLIIVGCTLVAMIDIERLIIHFQN